MLCRYLQFAIPLQSIIDVPKLNSTIFINGTDVLYQVGHFEVVECSLGFRRRVMAESYRRQMCSKELGLACVRCYALKRLYGG